MIIRRNLKLSVIARTTWRSVLYFAVIGLAAGLLDWRHDLPKDFLPATAVSALSAALAIFLAFRNSSAYDRWWEARKQWGTLINSSRNFARQATTFFTPDDGELTKLLIYRQMAFAHALRLALRGQQQDYRAVLEPLLPAEELTRVLGSANAPATIVLLQGESLRDAARAKRIDDVRAMQLDATLNSFTDVQGACERIKNTPLPRQYDFYPRIFVLVYTTLLPLSLCANLGLFTPLVTVPVSFLFIVLEGIGRVIEAPFENRIQDVPLTAMCRTIERSLRDALSEKGLPAVLEPEDGYLM